MRDAHVELEMDIEGDNVTASFSVEGDANGHVIAKGDLTFDVLAVQPVFDKLKKLFIPAVPTPAPPTQ